MSDLSDFIDSYGPPRNARVVSQMDAARYVGRVPDGLLALWAEHGVGSYANGCFWTCFPDIFDAVLGDVVSALNEFAPGDLTVFGYSCLGTLDLSHKSGRHLTLDITTGLLMDISSLQKTAPVPYDLDELAAAIGASPDELKDAFLQSQQLPADFWMTLSSLADGTTYSVILDDSGNPLINQLQRTLGQLASGQIYFQHDPSKGNLATAYGVADFREVLNEYPSRLLYTRYIQSGGEQTVVETEVDVARSL